MQKLRLTLTKKQKAFVDATADEVLFGGAAGGGKSWGQMADALLYALRYPRSRQLILRRTMPELEKTLLRIAEELYPPTLFTYKRGEKTGYFINGSLLDFGYLDAEADVYRYQGGEWDVIRFDEATHFTSFQYLYLLSRCRGADPYPKCVKCSGNPGGVGHAFFKERFVDPAPPGTTFSAQGGTRLYLPAGLFDNRFLTKADPAYGRRLALLPERERRMLLEGDWNVAGGARFSRFDPALHVREPAELPRGWRRYRAIDYGLDRLVCLYAAVSPAGRVFVYREISEKSKTIGEAATLMRERAYGETIYATLAPDDLWSRGQESGKSRALLFADAGVPLTKVSRDRAAGWAAVDDWLAPKEDGKPTLTVFANCTELIRCLPLLQVDPDRPDDVLTEPHDLTHAPDALRYLATWFVSPARAAVSAPLDDWTADMREDYAAADARGRAELLRRWGYKNKEET